ncbi:MAG: YceI family protein [Geminicoccaceae bacterium]|jgi:polyisoprenoid-binding protein YceI|nr:YceI family protein [Geminicoccaceae bacterium]MCB9967101.1 YceI family protein [Geminicoccaceae bacterium]HRY23075.1 YceI family protein [Geminicoccaceae bacterium]
MRLPVALLVLLTALPAAARDWRMIDDESSLAFTFKQMGSPVTGRFETFTAAISFDPAAPDAASVEAVIEIASVDTGNAERDAGIGGPDWFDAATYPTARFVSTGFTATGGDSYDVAGELTIRDVTDAVVLPMTIAVDGDRAVATGTLELDRTTFGVGQGDWASATAVGHEVLLEIEVVATAED